MEDNDLTRAIIGAAIAVHRALGPGLREATYQRCMAIALRNAQVPHERQVPLLLEFMGVRLGAVYRLDFVVAARIVVELKAIPLLRPIDGNQVLSYMRLGGYPLGLLFNFRVPVLKDGIRRFIHRPS